MRHSTFLIIATVLAIALCSGCNSAPGRPRPESKVLSPKKIVNFETLYQQNCAGCHGAQGGGGAAIGLNSQGYLAIANDATIRRVTSEGVPGTAMPAFAQSSGGMLTDEQINAIVTGIRTSWAKPGHIDLAPPSYAALTVGDPKHGAEAYATYCSSCHGNAGQGGSRAGSIVDESYLPLVSDQYLRTIVIVGRPEIGHPDSRGDVPGKPMSQQDVSDVVAWLSAQRPKIPMQWHSSATSGAGGTK
jgi:mono/diheme cytochrome c family protein